MPVLLPSDSPWTLRVERVAAGRVAWLRGPGVRWALLADTHVSVDAEAQYDGFRTLGGAERAVSEALAAGVDGAIVNGDLAWALGAPGDYERLADTFAPLARRAPLVLAPGNHDDRENLVRRFRPEAFGLAEPPKLITVIDTPPARMIALDSLYRTDVVPGLLGEAQRRWLAATLDAEPNRPTVLFAHHPLGEDDGALLDGDRLLALVQPRRQVKAIFTAHDHVWRPERRGLLHVIGMPATSFAFLPTIRIGWVEAHFDSNGARLTWRSLQGEVEYLADWRP
jgi:3',5'-cyclic AMP phosphodiesterase CpdA